jgi:mono/diheme cytochrome c family protein
LMDRRLGAITAATLVATGLAAAGALRFAVTAKPGAARALFALALLASGATLAVRAIELPGIGRRAGFASPQADRGSIASQNAPGAIVTHVGDAVPGKKIFLGTCAACHAPDGTGVKGQGQNLRDSTFLKDKTDEKALAFVKTGRQPFDPESKLHLAMPARGGNPSLTDASLLDAIAYVRELQKQPAAAPATRAAAVAVATSANRSGSPDQPQMIDGVLWIPHSILPAAQSGPTGTVPWIVSLQKLGAEGRTAANVRRFFLIVLAVNVLHTVFVLFGLGLGACLFTATARGIACRASLAAAAAYWVVISAIGLLLIPAFYA